MHALQVPGYSYICPNCGLCGSSEPLETDLPSVQIMTMDESKYLESYGEHSYYEHCPAVETVYVCKDCEYKFSADNKPTTFKNWRCGECSSEYYGEGGRDQAQDCCI